ncbi:MAG: preprotein translocase subunit SecD, partial [Chryseobacterium sp.]
MQGKGLITIIAIVLGLICLNELIPTWYASKIESQIEAAKGNEKEIKRIKEQTLNLGYTELTYAKAKDKEMKLGLDLKGGINVLLEINQRDLVNDLTNFSTNPILIEALNKTDEAQKNSTKSYIDNFFDQFDAVNKAKGANLKLADSEIFGNTNLNIPYNATDDQVKSIVKKRI